jgi:hypothetical protein
MKDNISIVVYDGGDEDKAPYVNKIIYDGGGEDADLEKNN